jgi:caffeoyl-CoA O-methyltransferase
MARRYWQEAGVTHKIDLRLGPAVETLAQLIEAGETEQFDLAFIDADKSN